MINLSKLKELFEVTPDSPSGLSWKVERRMGKGVGYVYAKPGDTVGCFDGYWNVIVDGVKLKVHRIVYAIANNSDSLEGIVDHIDGNRSNNSPINLRLVDAKINSRNKKRQVNNNTGKSGIHFDVKSSRTYSVVTWYELDGTKRTKAFSSVKHGLLESFNLACKHRDSVISELNKSNAGYTCRHGKDLS